MTTNACAKTVEVKDNVITAKSEGSAVIKVELKNKVIQNEIYLAVCKKTGKTFNNKLSTGVIYLDVTVTK